AANRRINNPHLIFWQVQRMCNLPQVFMHPLPGDADGNPPLFVDITETSFWLKKCMFLITGTILAFDDHISLCPCRINVPPAHLIMTEDISGIIGMDLRRVG